MSLLSKHRNLLMVGLVFLLTRTSPAQFHTDSQEVLADVAVTDKKGAVPRDLAAQDFKILEDGKEQKITSFSFTGNAAPGHTGKHFVALVFDREEPAFREEAIRFVDRYAGPDLYIAIYARVEEEINLIQSFTTDPVRLKTALRNMQIVGESKIMAIVKTDDPKYNGRIPHVLLLDRIDKVTAELKPIHGRKALVLFANPLIWFGAADPGIPAHALPPTDVQFLKTFDNCNQANVAIYGFNIGPDAGIGSASNWYDDHRTVPAAATNRILDLAAHTGGKYGTPGSNQLAEYLGSIATEQDNYYVLGYVPSADSAAKNCHKLKVTVDRKGLDVTARDTVCTNSPEPALKPEQKALEAKAANGAPGTIATSMQLTWFYTKPGTAITDIAVDISASVSQTKGKLRILGVAYRADGSVATRFGQTIDQNFETPVHYSKQIALPPGSYRLRVTAGAADQAFGNIEKPLEIKPWSGETLSASALVLGDHDTPLTDATSTLDNSLLEGPHRLASNGREFTPIGGTQFHSGQQGLFYIEIYDPSLAATPPTIDATIIDRATASQKIDSGPMTTAPWTHPGSAAIPIAMRFPITDLPPGNYTLEIRVTRDGNDEVVRTAEFEVK